MANENQSLQTPLISVIVPAYNAARWIRDCCDSVFHQSYPNWELIVVDDGSEDDTLVIARETAGDRENVTVLHSDHGGVCRARNLGLDAAKGEYLTFLDADDGLMPNALQMLFDRAQTTGADIVAGEVDASLEKECWCGKDALIKSLEDHPAGYAVWGKLYRSAIVDGIRFVEGRKIHEDSFFVFQCFLKQPLVAFHAEKVIWRNLLPGSASRSDFSEKFFDILYFAEEKVRLIREQYPELNGLTDNLLIKANMALLRNLCKTYDRRYRQAEKNCIQTIREKRRAFRPAMKADERWFWVITHYLFPLYKVVFYFRRKIRKRTHAK